MNHHHHHHHHHQQQQQQQQQEQQQEPSMNIKSFYQHHASNEGPCPTATNTARTASLGYGREKAERRVPWQGLRVVRGAEGCFLCGQPGQVAQLVEQEFQVQELCYLENGKWMWETMALGKYNFKNSWGFNSCIWWGCWVLLLINLPTDFEVWLVVPKKISKLPSVGYNDAVEDVWVWVKGFFSYTTRVSLCHSPKEKWGVNSPTTLVVVVTIRFFFGGWVHPQKTYSSRKLRVSFRVHPVFWGVRRPYVSGGSTVPIDP